MRLNGKDINIEDIITEVDIDKNIPKKRNNNLVLRDSQIEILKKYNINYEAHTSLKSLILFSLRFIKGNIPFFAQNRIVCSEISIFSATSFIVYILRNSFSLS